MTLYAKIDCKLIIYSLKHDLKSKTHCLQLHHSRITYWKLCIVVEIQGLHHDDGLPEHLVEAPGLVDGQRDSVGYIAVRTLAGTGTVRRNPEGEDVYVDSGPEEGVIEHIGAWV